MTAAACAYDWAVKIASDQKHGYSQESRWGTPGIVSDFDCSSLVISAYEQAGVPLKSKGATYTGNLREVALACGFEDVTKKVNLNTGAGLKKGDILMYHKSGPIGHTALAGGDGKIVHARGQSYGSPSPGDQGSEIAVSAYYRGSWTTVLRYNEETRTALVISVKVWKSGRRSSVRQRTVSLVLRRRLLRSHFSRSISWRWMVSQVRKVGEQG